MRIFNIMASRDSGGIQQSFVDYSIALLMQGHQVINIVSSFAEISYKVEGKAPLFRLPNLSPRCFISKVYLRILISLHKPNLILAHGGRAIDFAKSLKPYSLPLIGIAHNYKTKRLKKCDYIISITEELIGYLTEREFDRSKIFHIPNMIAITKKYADRKFKSPIVIGSCGRFVAKKGFNYLIEAIFLLKSRRHEVKLILGGDGEDNEILRNLVLKMNLEKEVTFLGWVTDKDNFFSLIDIFCLPSISEPFGIILLEAAARSTPIVATKSGGPNEILRDEKDALLTDIKSGIDLADKLAILIQDQVKARSLSYFAYLRLQRYDIKAVSEKLSDILTTLPPLMRRN